MSEPVYPLDCANCHKRLPGAYSDGTGLKPCPYCGSEDRIARVASHDVGQGDDSATVLHRAFEVVGRAGPADVASALNRLANQLGASIAFTTGAAGVDIVRDGRVEHYAFADTAEAIAAAFDASVIVSVSPADSAELSAEIEGAAREPILTLDRAISIVVWALLCVAMRQQLSGEEFSAVTWMMVSQMVDQIKKMRDS